MSIKLSCSLGKQVRPLKARSSLNFTLVAVVHLIFEVVGVGKSVIAKAVLNAIVSRGNWLPITLNFSAQTSSARTQEMIETKLERKKKNLLGAPAGKRLILFVDDVNMPKLDTYGSQPPIELLR